MFYREGLLAPRPTPKLEDHPSSAVRDYLFNIFAAALLIGGLSSIRNLRTRHAVVTGTHYMAVIRYYILKILPALILMKSIKYIAYCICYPTRVPNSQKESNL